MTPVTQSQQQGIQLSETARRHVQLLRDKQGKDSLPSVECVREGALGCLT
jgi:hypothetical protein